MPYRISRLLNIYLVMTGYEDFQELDSPEYKEDALSEFERGYLTANEPEFAGRPIAKNWWMHYSAKAVVSAIAHIMGRVKRHRRDLKVIVGDPVLP
jgi:hypothetical protein